MLLTTTITSALATLPTHGSPQSIDRSDTMSMIGFAASIGGGLLMAGILAWFIVMMRRGRGGTERQIR